MTKRYISSTIFSIVAVVIAPLLLATVVGFQRADATMVTGNNRVVQQQMTAVAASITYGTPVSNNEYGETEAWVIPTTVPTDFVGYIKTQACSDAGLTCVDITPTVISGGITVTNETRSTPFVVQFPNVGGYHRIAIHTTSEISSGLTIRWHQRNTTN